MAPPCFVQTNSAANVAELFEAEAEGAQALALGRNAELRIPAPLF